MTFKFYVKYFFIIVIMIIISVISLNIYLNEFGLFGNVKGKKYRVFANERTTKYLFSFKWIPQNFDGFLIGPSLSDIEMDTSKIDKFRVYNLSLNGGNISELKYLVDNVIKNGKMKLMIVCLTPYITKNSGKKTNAIDPKEYWSTFGSLFTIKYYLKKSLITSTPNKDPFINSWNGYRLNNYNTSLKFDSKTVINNTYNSILNKEFKIDIDSKAIKELSSIFDLARKNNVQILTYYYPVHKKIFSMKLYQSEYLKYKDIIQKILKSQDIVIDFNTTKYDYIRSSYDTYSDGGHLSKIGGERIMKVINNIVNNNYKD